MLKSRLLLPALVAKQLAPVVAPLFQKSAVFLTYVSIPRRKKDER